MSRLAVSHFDRKLIMWPENQTVAEMPVARYTLARLLLLSALALSLGVACDLASCRRIPLPARFVPLLTGCYYAAIVLAATVLVWRQPFWCVWFTSLSV